MKWRIYAFEKCVTIRLVDWTVCKCWPLSTPKSVCARIWTLEQWKKVVWIDKCHFLCVSLNWGALWEDIKPAEEGWSYRKYPAGRSWVCYFGIYNFSKFCNCSGLFQQDNTEPFHTARILQEWQSSRWLHYPCSPEPTVECTGQTSPQRPHLSCWSRLHRTPSGVLWSPCLKGTDLFWGTTLSRLF